MAMCVQPYKEAEVGTATAAILRVVWQGFLTIHAPLEDTVAHWCATAVDAFANGYVCADMQKGQKE